jgi:sugar O-acyltransferase (sialic acid O-acetyltransferase NeuD family)
MSTPKSTSLHSLAIIGAGSFGVVAARLAETERLGHNGDGPARWNVVGYVDTNPAKRGMQHAGRPVFGNMEDLAAEFHGRSLWFFCAIGDNAARARMTERALELGWKPITLVHPSAILDATVEIGAGTYIGPAAVVAFKAIIGSHVLIDMHVSVGHESQVMDFSSLFPGARISGNCRVGQGALIGSNATLLPGTLVGDGAVVGANSLAHGWVPPDTTILGVPARMIRKRAVPFSAQEPLRTAKEVNYVIDQPGEDR